MLIEENGLEPPRKRPMNDDPDDDFVAIDFETMTPVRTSACAIGMVKVIDGQIVQQFYSLINPVRDKYTDDEPCKRIHGISLETVEKAVTFAELFDGIRNFIGGLPIVCHNRSMDIAVLDQLMEYYGLSGIDTSTSICTYHLTGKSLSACCAEYGIPEENHHNALWDAEACARIYLELIGKPMKIQGGNPVFGKRGPLSGHTPIAAENRCRISDDKVLNKDTLFFNSTVVISGTFERYSDRNALASIIQALGGRIVSSVSSRTQFVVAGDSPGPKKLEQVRQLQEKGHPIRIINKDELDAVIRKSHVMAAILGLTDGTNDSEFDPELLENL